MPNLYDLGACLGEFPGDSAGVPITFDEDVTIAGLVSALAFRTPSRDYWIREARKFETKEIERAKARQTR